MDTTPRRGRGDRGGLSSWRTNDVKRLNTLPSLPALLDRLHEQLVAQKSRAASPNCGSWSVVASPNNGTNSNYLYGVTTISSNNVWAAGYYVNTNQSINQTLTEQWNGTSWSVVTSANVGTGSNAFLGVAATAGDVWAVGDYNNSSNVNQTLTEFYC